MRRPSRVFALALVLAVSTLAFASGQASANAGAGVNEANAQANARALNPDGTLRRVLYPMGLVDVASAFRLFEGPRGGASHVLIVDGGLAKLGTPDTIRAARRSVERRDAHLAKMAERDYLHNGLPHDEDAAGARIHWDLERMGADQIAMVPGSDGSTELTFRWRGQPRRVTLVPAWLDDRDLPPAVGRFLADGVDAIYEKASGPSLLAEPELMRFVQTAVRRLDRRHGVVVTDDPTWADAAELGLVPLAARGTLPRRFGYLLFRAEMPLDKGERRGTIPMNPILVRERGGARDRLRAGRKALEARAVQAAATPGAAAIPALEAIAGLRARRAFGGDDVLLDLVDGASRAHGVSTDHGRAARPILTRLAAAEAVADPPGEHEGMTAHRLDASLLGAIAALRPRNAVRDVVGIAIARARTDRALSPYLLQDFLHAVSDGRDVSIDTMLGVIDRFQGARGLDASQRAWFVRTLQHDLASSIASTHGVLKHLGRTVPGVDMSQRLSSFDLEDQPVEELVTLARTVSRAWKDELAHDPRSARYLGDLRAKPSFKPFPVPRARAPRR